MFTCRFGAHDRASYQVIGTAGALTLDNACAYDADMHLHVDGTHGSTHRTFPRRDQIAAELAYVAACIRDDVAPGPSGWEGLADVRILQAIRASARFGRSVPIDPMPLPLPRRRPDFGQEIRIEAAAVPALVDVEQPTA